MLIIKVYSVMDDLVVSVSSVANRPLDAHEPVRAQSLHYHMVPTESVGRDQTLAQVVKEAVQQADGYAGDLIDHARS